MTHPYACAKCGAQVFVDPRGNVTRPCLHSKDTIIAERTCNLYGDGGAETTSLADRARAALDKLVTAFAKG